MVIFRRRGGDDLEQSYSKRARTVEGAPGMINMTFVPIISLLEGVAGIKHLARAIELYLDSNFCYYAISPVLCSSKSSVFRRNMI